MAIHTRLSIAILSLIGMFISGHANAQWQATRSDFTSIHRYREILPLQQDEFVFLSPQQIKDIECISWALYFEARGSSKDDQIAVAWVTVNRSQSDIFHSDICTNIFQYGYVNGVKAYQFNWAANRPSRNMKVEHVPWLTAQELAIAVYLGYIPDPTNGALYFKGMRDPDWAPARKKIRIGGHLFWQ